MRVGRQGRGRVGRQKPAEGDLPASPLPCRQISVKTQAHKREPPQAGWFKKKMSDDSFFREVNEEIRQDQARALWDRYGPYAIAIAVAVVLATAAFVAYEYWVETRANASGDTFSQALVLANEGKH